MQRKILAAAIFALFACSSSPLFAQSAPLILPSGCGTAALVTGSGYQTVDSTGKLCVNATVSASISPFTPGASGARGTPLTVTVADSSGSLPTNGGAVVVTNTGSNPVFCNVNGVAATTFDQEIAPSGGWFNFGIPSGQTALHCIATGGSSTANTLGGSGLATGTGGGSGGGGSGGTVAQGTGGASAWLVTGTGGTFPVTGTFWQATQPISVASLPLPSGAATQTTSAAILTALGTPMQNSGGSVTANLGTIGTAATAANQTTGNTSLATIATNSGLPLPAQSNTTTNVGAVSGIVNVTPTDCSGTVTTGGTAQSAISASATIHGFTIANVDASAGSGEPLWISFTGTASAANGSYPLAPPAATTFASNGSYTTPMGFGANHAVSIFAATTGHKFSCTTW